MYYARIAENTYARRYANSQEAPSMYVLVDMKDDFCMLALEADFSYSPSILVFSCKKLNGVVTTTFVRHSASRVENALMLYDMYDIVEGYDGEDLGGKCEEARIKIPEECTEYPRQFFKIKLLGLDEFVDDCCFKGWGDLLTGNALDAICAIMRQKFIDMESQTVRGFLYCDLGYGKTENDNRLITFKFSHFELAKSSEARCASVIFACYDYYTWEYIDEKYGTYSGIE